MPLPNDSVIPAGFAAFHADTVAGQMTATGTITIPASQADATFDETTGRTAPGTATTIYTGRMRVQRLMPGPVAVAVEIGDRTVILRQYQATIPTDGPTQPIPIGAIVTLTDNPDDPDLVGVPLHVRGVQSGSIMWQRDLLCEDVAPTQR